MKSWNMVSLPCWGQCGNGSSYCIGGDQFKVLVALESLLTFHFTSELTVADRRQKREIRQLEQELHKWQVLVDSITGEGARGQSPPCILVPLSPSFPCLSGVLFPRPTLVSCPSLTDWVFPALLSGMSSPDFDNQTLAVLRGRMVRYLMRSREVRQAVTVLILPKHALCRPFLCPVLDFCLSLTHWGFFSFLTPALTSTTFPDNPGQSNQGQPN